MSVRDMNSQGSQYIARQCLELQASNAAAAQRGAGPRAATGAALVSGAPDASSCAAAAGAPFCQLLIAFLSAYLLAS